MTAYYNEIDPYAAQWLRNLIVAGRIAPGDVDERDIRDIKPNELRGYTQCHFFAGIGVWSYALRLAGWPDDRPVWTGSCPCQPFSSAGMARGFADERHLWPFFHFLIGECGPPVVFGEQVANKDGLAWLDLVQADMEGTGYTFAAVDLCAAGVGAPHIRQRLWFVGEWLGDTNDTGLERRSGDTTGEGESVAPPNEFSGLADLHADGFGEGRGSSSEARGGGAVGNRAACGLANSKCLQEHEEQQRPAKDERWRSTNESSRCRLVGASTPTSPTDGFWRDVDWLFCRDGKWRPVEPGTFPLAHGSTQRVGRLRAYGNAINAQAAKEVIAVYMELRP